MTAKQRKQAAEAKSFFKGVGIGVGDLIIGSKAMADFQAGNWRKGLEAGAEMLAIQIGIQLAVTAVGALTGGVGSAPVEAALEAAATGSRLATESATVAATTAAQGAEQAAAQGAEQAAARGAEQAATEAGTRGVVVATKTASPAAETRLVNSVSGVSTKASVGSGGGGEGSLDQITNPMKNRSTAISKELQLEKFKGKVKDSELKQFIEDATSKGKGKGSLIRNEESYRAHFDELLRKNTGLKDKYGINNAEEGLDTLRRLEETNPRKAREFYNAFMSSQRGVTSGGRVGEFNMFQRLLGRFSSLTVGDQEFITQFLDSNTFVARELKGFLDLPQLPSIGMKTSESVGLITIGVASR